MDKRFPALIGKTALLTGAAKRLGRTVALSLADSGCSVIVHYNRSESDALDVAEEAKKSGVKAWTISADLTDIGQVKRLIGSACDRASKIDFLVNNASIFPLSTLYDIDTDSMQETMNVNALAPFILSREFARHTEAGAIVNPVSYTHLRAHET